MRGFEKEKWWEEHIPNNFYQRKQITVRDGVSTCYEHKERINVQ